MALIPGREIAQTALQRIFGVVEVSRLPNITIVGADVAHDAADSGNPLKVGGKAETTTPTAVADADRVNAWFDEYGRLVTIENAGFSTRADTYTATGNGTTVDRLVRPVRNYAIQVVQTGTVTAWDVRLEGSLDGTNFSQVLQHTNTDGSGLVKFSTASSPCLYFRSRCAGLTLGVGTNVIATILGTT